MKSLGLLLFCLIPAQAVTVNIYSGLPGNTGNGQSGPLNFSGDTLAGTFFSPDINFGVSNQAWDPLGLLQNYGADITASIVVVAAGTYTFNTSSDDGSMLFIDGTEVVNNNFSQGFTERQGSIDLTAGTHTFEVQYYQGGGGNALAVTLPGGVTYTADQQSGLAISIYQDPNSPPTVPPLVPPDAVYVGSIPIVDNTVSFGLPNSNWQPFGLLQNFSADMQGSFIVPTSGNYTFSTGSDDGSDLFIDGQLVVNNAFYQGYTIRQQTVFLNAGVHPFDLQYFQGGGGAALTMGVPAGVQIEPMPEPATWVPLVALGGWAATALLRRRRFSR